MADLSDVQTASTVKIVGADSAGVETNVVNTSNSPTLSDASFGLIVRPLPYEPQTYSCVSKSFVSAATATDVWLFQGSATKTIRIHKIKISGTTSSGAPIKVTMSLVIRSTANTGGTSVAATAVPHDSNNAAATATIVHYTANPTVGTSIGEIRANTTAIQSDGFTDNMPLWDFETGGQPIILRGTNQYLAINFNSTTVNNSLFSINCEWSEV